MRKTAAFKLIIAFVVSFFILWGGISLGSTNLPFGDTIKVFFEKVFKVSLGTEARIQIIVWNLRFPRAVLAFLIGGALS